MRIFRDQLFANLNINETVLKSYTWFYQNSSKKKRKKNYFIYKAVEIPLFSDKTYAHALKNKVWNSHKQNMNPPQNA